MTFEVSEYAEMTRRAELDVCSESNTETRRSAPDSVSAFRYFLTFLVKFEYIFTMKLLVNYENVSSMIKKMLRIDIDDA